MKKNVIMRIAAVVLMCTLVTACFASSTFAKYTSQATGTGTAKVAQWAFEVEDEDITTSETFTFNLFDTVVDDNFETESDVAAGLIAPGTAGEFYLDLKNTSEVTAIVELTLAENANSHENIPIVFSTDKNTWKSASEFTIEPIEVAINATDKTPTIYWKWAFEANDDETDTALGIEEAATDNSVQYMLDVVVTATQKN